MKLREMIHISTTFIMFGMLLSHLLFPHKYYWLLENEIVIEKVFHALWAEDIK